MRRLMLVAALGLLVGGCGGSSTNSTVSSFTGSAGGRAPTSIQLTSPAFAPGGPIPSRYTCDGAEVSLPLRWSGVPAGARALNLVMRDPDAPGGNFIHWSLTGIPPTVTALAAGRVPAGVTQRSNGFGTTGYRGPCPPRGDKPHHYEITLTALSASGSQALAAGTLTGTYARR